MLPLLVHCSSSDATCSAADRVSTFSVRVCVFEAIFNAMVAETARAGLWWSVIGLCVVALATGLVVG